MYKRPKKKQLTQDAVPTTSLADMMFLLLIFFLMTSTLARVTGFVTDMPASGKGDQQQQQKTTTVALHEDKITVNDEDMTMDGMRRYLKGLNLAQKVGDAKVIIVQATGNVKYQNYYETMATIQTCGGVVAIVSEEGK